MSGRLCLYRRGSAGPISCAPESDVTSEPAESRRGGLSVPRWLFAKFYAVPKSGPFSDRLRLCPEDEARALAVLDAEISRLRRERRDLLEEAWRRADRYRGPSR